MSEKKLPLGDAYWYAKSYVDAAKDHFLKADQEYMLIDVLNIAKQRQIDAKHNIDHLLKKLNDAMQDETSASLMVTAAQQALEEWSKANKKG